jgi:hypothetical protein
MLKKKKFGPIFKELYNFFFTQKLSLSSQKYGFGIQRSKRHWIRDHGSRIRICSGLFFYYFLLFIGQANGLSVRNELLSFHSKWYSSNIMSMAILGQQVGQIPLYDNNLYRLDLCSRRCFGSCLGPL